MSIVGQLVDEMGRSKAKTALLGLLILVGMYFWIPLLLDIVRGTAENQTSVAPTTVRSSLQPESAGHGVQPEANKTVGHQRSEAPNCLSWKDAEEIANTDTLVQPPDEIAQTTNPFEIDRDQFSPPVTDIFAHESKANGKLAERSNASASGDPQNLTGAVLKSIIVGVRQRAAYINNQLCFEGSQLVINGQAFQVVTIGRDRVELQSKSGRTYVLKLNRANAVAVSQSFIDPSRQPEFSTPRPSGGGGAPAR